MKSWTLNFGMMIAAITLLTACPDKDKGNSAVAPSNPGTGTGNGACVVDAQGNCAGGVPVSNFSGRWNGTLTIAPQAMELYRGFLIENGLCHGYDCQRMSQWVGVSVELRRGRTYLRITPHQFRGWSRRSLRELVQAYVLDGGAGFQVVYQPAPMNTAIWPPQNAAGMIQMTNMFVNPYGNLVNATLSYRGNVLANGQLQGFRRDQHPYPSQQQPNYQPQVLPPGAG